MQLYIQILRAFEESEKTKDTLSPKEKKLGSRLKNEYILKEEDDSTGHKSTVLFRIDRKKKRNKVPQLLRVIPNESIFDCIHAVHHSVGHDKEATYKGIKCRDIYSACERDIKNYIHTCPGCMRVKLSIPKLIAKKNPIWSSLFRDQLVVDYIDLKGVEGQVVQLCPQMIGNVRELKNVWP